ncbi:MAG: DUF3014 domain-containing protein [Motiliproteus sp.]
MLQRSNGSVRGIALIHLLLILVALLLVVGIGYLLLGPAQSPTYGVGSGAAGDGATEHQTARNGSDVEAANGVVSGTVIAPLQPSEVERGTTTNNPQLTLPPLASVAANNQQAPVAAASPKRPAVSLPGLNESDSLFRSALLGLAVDSLLAEWLVDEELIRKLVVTIDNMADGKIPRKHGLLMPMSDKFRVSKKGLEQWLDGYNHSRYNTYVELLTAVDAQQWADLYQNYYPLMQQAYAELGYPRKAFHDRVLLATERLLNSPVLAKPLALEQPSVMYTFADPELQDLSAVDKQMLRLGAINARQLKQVLTVLQAKLVAMNF